MTDAKTPVITRDDLVDALQRHRVAGSKKHLREVLDVLLAEQIAALRRGDIVHLKGFGRFQAVEMPERPGRNPKTGEPATIAAHLRVKFKPSKQILALGG